MHRNFVEFLWISIDFGGLCHVFDLSSKHQILLGFSGAFLLPYTRSLLSHHTFLLWLAVQSASSYLYSSATIVWWLQQPLVARILLYINRPVVPHAVAVVHVLSLVPGPPNNGLFLGSFSPMTFIFNSVSSYGYSLGDNSS
eukprot:Gb_39373 [translate_table: standard]